ncbi:DUF485 domain-containing protein [Deinococcus xinjiangensis]
MSLALAWKYIGGKQQFFQSCCIFGGQAGVKASDNVIYIRQLLMTITFMVLYFILPILAGYNKPLMATKVMGNITFGYVLAFLEIIMGWVMAAIYINKAKTFDRLAEEAKG